MSDFNTKDINCVANLPYPMASTCDVFVLDTAAPVGVVTLKTSDSDFILTPGRVYGVPGRTMGLISITSTATETLSLTYGMGTIIQPGGGAITGPITAIAEMTDIATGINFPLQTTNDRTLDVSMTSTPGVNYTTGQVIDTRTYGMLACLINGGANGDYFELNGSLGKLPFYDDFGRFYAKSRIVVDNQNTAGQRVFYVDVRGTDFVVVFSNGPFNPLYVVGAPEWSLPVPPNFISKEGTGAIFPLVVPIGGAAFIPDASVDPSNTLYRYLHGSSAIAPDSVSVQFNVMAGPGGSVIGLHVNTYGAQDVIAPQGPGFAYGAIVLQTSMAIALVAGNQSTGRIMLRKDRSGTSAGLIYFEIIDDVTGTQTVKTYPCAVMDSNDLLLLLYNVGGPDVFTIDNVSIEVSGVK